MYLIVNKTKKTHHFVDDIKKIKIKKDDDIEVHKLCVGRVAESKSGSEDLEHASRK